ncbi:MAG TPA: hypothetical protein VFQ36_24680 [Ktedonobacteraceae bacterium]|nr:hypothetical protein [Ktedonobacteraceae bacterium]
MAWRSGQGIGPRGPDEQEQTDEQHPDEFQPSQTAPAGPGSDQFVSDDHLAFPLAWDEEPATPASHVYRTQER